jgi:hypothetical protein
VLLPYQKLGVRIQEKRGIRKEPRRDPGREVAQRAEEQEEKEEKASAGTTVKTQFPLERCASGATNAKELTIGRRATTLALPTVPMRDSRRSDGCENVRVLCIVIVWHALRRRFSIGRLRILDGGIAVKIDGRMGA